MIHQEQNHIIQASVIVCINYVWAWYINNFKVFDLDLLFKVQVYSDQCIPIWEQSPIIPIPYVFPICLIIFLFNKTYLREAVVPLMSCLNVTDMEGKGKRPAFPRVERVEQHRFPVVSSFKWVIVLLFRQGWPRSAALGGGV